MVCWGLGINNLTSGARSLPDAVAGSFPGGRAAYEARVEVEVSRAD